MAKSYRIIWPSSSEYANSSKLKYQDKLIDEINFVLEEEIEYKNNEFEIFVDSYFEKKKFKKISGFFSSHLFKKLETRYSYLLKLDIKSCFDNIYTHSIDWAYLGEKELAKKLIGEKDRFSAKLDKLMQSANYNETNGIVVGPEFSRCVAEIVLMRIDYMVFITMKEKNFHFKKDYEVIRFIDDIYIFCNNSNVHKEIRFLYSEYCKYYKLDLNESKTFEEKRPFLRKGTWVPKLRIILDYYFNRLYKQFDVSSDQTTAILNKRGDFQRPSIRLIEDIRSIIVDHESETEKIISYVFTVFERQMKKIFKNLETLEEQSKAYLLISLIDELHYSLVFSISASHVLKYIMFMMKIYSYASAHTMVDVINLMFKKCLELLKYNTENNVELVNLIIFMRRFQKDLPEEIFGDFIKKDCGYFTLSTIMFYLSAIERKYRYKRTKEKINKLIYNLAEEVIEKHFNGSYNHKDGKNFLFGKDFYPIHDFYNHCILTNNTNKKIEIIKNKLLKITWGNNDNFFNTFWNYVKDFDKPFMRFEISDEGLVPEIILKASRNFEPQISG